MQRFTCSGCNVQESFDGRPGASNAGWALVELSADLRVRYLVYCPACRPKWVAQALSDERKPQKQKE